MHALYILLLYTDRSILHLYIHINLLIILVPFISLAVHACPLYFVCKYFEIEFDLYGVHVSSLFLLFPSHTRPVDLKEIDRGGYICDSISPFLFSAVCMDTRKTTLQLRHLFETSATASESIPFVLCNKRSNYMIASTDRFA